MAGPGSLSVWAGGAAQAKAQAAPRPASAGTRGSADCRQGVSDRNGGVRQERRRSKDKEGA